eukprot:GHVL01029425.1.p1 GENE.GHVL01029425.1~~GHVL01029425.1.p1  ORF type:complete len:415 (+),score=34.27 GHVL01029425.1:651-1895(+)
MKPKKYDAIRIFVITYICYASIYFTRKPLSLCKNRFAEEYGWSTDGLAYLDTCFLAFYAVGQFLISPLGDIYGPRYVSTIGFIFSTISCYLFSIFQNPFLLCVLCSLNGLAQASLFPLMLKVLHPYFGDNGKIIGVWSTCQQIGGVLSTIIGVSLMTWVGWRATFQISSIWCILCAVTLFFGLKDSSTLQQKSNASTESVSKKRITHVWNIPGIFNIGLSYCGTKFVRYALIMWLSYYLSAHNGFSDILAGYCSTFFDVGGIGGAIICGYLSDLLKSRMLVILPISLVGAMVCVAYACIPASNIFIIHCILLFSLGLSIGGLDSILGGAATGELCEKHNCKHLLTAASGLANGMGSIGATFQGTLTAYVSQTFGWSPWFILLAVTTAGSAIVLIPSLIQELKLKKINSQKKRMN